MISKKGILFEKKCALRNSKNHFFNQSHQKSFLTPLPPGGGKELVLYEIKLRSEKKIFNQIQWKIQSEKPD